MSARIEPVSFPLAAVQQFDEIIDVRSPCEFAEDHLTGAVNAPVLSNEERAEVGTLYQSNRFEARKLGAALISANISSHLRAHFSDKPRNYRPLVYCWRGGQRSQSLATILAEIGWRTGLVQGGYKAYREHVRRSIEARPESLRFCVINGLTGSGKTRMLAALEAEGAQVLDLEEMARHKGSLFGADLTRPQPSQKHFESLLYDRLCHFSGEAPVYVEAESPKIGRLNIPLPLWKRMRQSEVIELSTSLLNRVAFLQSDYRAWLAEPERVQGTIDLLQPFHARDCLALWKTWCSEGNWAKLIEALLVEHYDRRYGVNGSGYFREPARRYHLDDHREASLRACALAIQKGAERGSRLLPAAG